MIGSVSAVTQFEILLRIGWPSQSVVRSVLWAATKICHPWN